MAKDKASATRYSMAPSLNLSSVPSFEVYFYLMVHVPLLESWITHLTEANVELRVQSTEEDSRDAIEIRTMSLRVILDTDGFDSIPGLQPEK